MRATLYLLTVIACGVVGFAIARTVPGGTGADRSIGLAASQSVDGALQPSFVGRAVKVYFRGVDDLPFPEMKPAQAGQLSLAMKLTYFSGVIKQAKGGWIEVTPVDPSVGAAIWVSTQSVAYIVADDSGTATTRP